MSRNEALILILADDREQKGVIPVLAEMETVKLQIQRLPLGDYQVEGRGVVERKALKDFAVSIIDGRLFEQMIRRANAALKSVLILEGTTGDAVALGVTREAMQGRS